MAAEDPCLTKIEKSWKEASHLKRFKDCGKILRLLVNYLAVCGELPEAWSPVVKKRIVFLEKKLDSLGLRESESVIRDIKYARQRLSGRSVEYGKHFAAGAEVPRAERHRAARTLDSPFLARLTRPVVAFTDPLDVIDEPGGDDLGVTGPELD